MPGWLVGIREKRAKQQAEQDAIKKKSSVMFNSLVLSTLDFGLCFLSLVVKKKFDNKLFFFIFLFFGVKDHPRSHNWTLDFEPTFSQQVYFPLSPRSLFPTRQRFPFPNHVTSGCMSPRSLFSLLVSGFPLLKTRDFRFRL